MNIHIYIFIFRCENKNIYVFTKKKMLEILITLTTMALLGCSKENKNKFFKIRPKVSNLYLKKKKMVNTSKYFYCMDITDKHKKKNVKESIIMDKSSHLYYIFLEEINDKSLRVIAEINSPEDDTPVFSGVSGYILKGVNNFSNIGKNLTNEDYRMKEGVTIENISEDFKFIISNNNCRLFTFDNENTKFRIVYSGSITLPVEWSTKYTKITGSEKEFTHLVKDKLKECPSGLKWKNGIGCCKKWMGDKNCKSCNTEGWCGKCKDGMSWKSGIGCCNESMNDKNCKSCNTEGWCGKCKDGMEWKDGGCM